MSPGHPCIPAWEFRIRVGPWARRIVAVALSVATPAAR